MPAAYPADSFPQGLKRFRETVGADKVIWVHNGLWTDKSPYRKQYPFADNDPMGPPQGPALWNHVFSENKKWGLTTIKQDHLKQQVDATETAYVK